MLTVEQVLAKQKQAVELSTKIQMLKARAEEQKKRRDTILENYKVKDTAALHKLREQSYAKVEATYAKYDAYVNEQMPIVAQLEAQL